uniref:Uncharacterized protein n=1 Tax=Romanomermis culicivorax TaxID=13658 RepID=A0A915KZ03_ROMCU
MQETLDAFKVDESKEQIAQGMTERRKPPADADGGLCIQADADGGPHFLGGFGLKDGLRMTESGDSATLSQHVSNSRIPKMKPTISSSEIDPIVANPLSNQRSNTSLHSQIPRRVSQSQILETCNFVIIDYVKIFKQAWPYTVIARISKNRILTRCGMLCNYMDIQSVDKVSEIEAMNDTLVMSNS